MNFSIGTTIRPGTHRPSSSGTVAPRGLAMRGASNPLIEACPAPHIEGCAGDGDCTCPKDYDAGCGARRYERCFKVLYAGTESEFLDYLSRTHPARVRLVASKHQTKQY